MHKLKLNIIKVRFNFALLVFTILLNFSLILLNFTTSDQGTILLFARHYKEDWFSLTIPQVGGGLDLRTSPPLVPHIIALFSFVFQLESSYDILLFLFLLIFPFYFIKFCYTLIDLKDTKTFWLSYLLVSSSLGLLRLIFTHGQLETLVALAFGFISLDYFTKGLKNSKIKYFIFASIALSLTAFSHIMGTIITIFVYFFVIAFNYKKFIPNLKKTIIFCLISFVLVSLGILPLIQKVFFQTAIPLKEIPHNSRYPLLSGNFYMWFFTIFGLSLVGFLVPMLPLKLEYSKKLTIIIIIAFFFFLIGSGRQTPVDKLIFGNFEYWLIYDPFYFASSIFLLVTLAFGICYISKIFSQWKNIFLTIVLVMYVFLNISELFIAHTINFLVPINFQNTVRENETEYVLNFLNKNISKDFRYQTFGYRNPVTDLELFTNVSTLDTHYFTGRSIDFIRNSGLAEIDSVSNYNFLNEFIAKSAENSVKYVITFNSFYHNFMSTKSWTMIENKTFGTQNVIIWLNPSNVKPIEIPKEKIGLANYLWGIIPLLTLIIFLIGALYAKKK